MACTAPRFEAVGTDSGSTGGSSGSGALGGAAGAGGNSGASGSAGAGGGAGAGGSAGSDASAGGTGGLLDAGASGGNGGFPDAGKDAGCSKVNHLTAVLSPSIVKPGVSGVLSPWNNLTAVTTADQVDASASLSAASPLTAKLQPTGFSANIPSGASILGIEVKVRHKAANVNSLRDSSVRLITSAGPKGINYAKLASNWDNVYLNVAYGGLTDKWGENWTAAELNHPEFGVSLEASCPSPCGNNQARVDHVTVRIAYRTCP